ncbi:MAG: hypothetical protein ACXVB9_04445 [Bdellovibrionota bacterium]
MSKLSPLSQSMASLFTPESERLRAGQGREERAARLTQIPGAKDIKGHKSGDSLGNPNSPGYEPWGKKKKDGQAPEKEAAGAPAGTVIEPPTQGPTLIRLMVGWEKILLTQKKLCEKAKGIFTRMEGPENYRTQKKSKILSIKSRGCIVDLDIQTVQDEKAAEAKSKLPDSA